MKNHLNRLDKLLTKDQCDGISDWKDLGRYDRMKQFLNKDGCGYLNTINKKKENSKGALRR